MVAARLVTTKLGDNQFTEGRSIDPSSQSEAAALLSVSTPTVKRAQALLRRGRSHPDARLSRRELSLDLCIDSR